MNGDKWEEKALKIGTFLNFLYRVAHEITEQLYSRFSGLCSIQVSYFLHFVGYQHLGSHYNNIKIINLA